MKNKKSKERFAVIAKYFFILVISSMVGLILLVGVSFLPTEKINNNVKKDINQLYQETSYFSAFGGNVPGTKQDNYTEAIYLGQILIGDGMQGRLNSALNGYYIYRTGDLVEDLYKYISRDDSAQIAPLEHFWAGWLTILKPMFVFMTYSQIRMFNLTAHSLLLFTLLVLLRKKDMTEIQFPLLLACLFMNPVTMGLTMTFAGYYYEILVACIIVVKFNDKLLEKKWYGFFFCLLGITVIYFNMNYFQLCTLGFPLILYFYINKKTIVDMLKETIKLGGSWMFGFFGMMFAKWVIYAIFVDKSIFVNQFQHILFRLGDNSGGVNTPRVEAVSQNFKYIYDNKIWLLIEILYLLYVIYNIKKILKNNNTIVTEGYFTDLVFLFLTFFVVIARYFLEANHSYIHHWVVYRNIAICIFAINAFGARFIRINRNIIESD